ncbi:hypothetical protein [Nesterenkonia sphaerica]|uniref:Uncharacterized protein n=1 Tax=Nesterenkonia sphaerica TaxID=1804988 RepID=A0A5R9AHI1_9MICC|nr:hypothetical protein [Nesterenkonia sphaerica]TLP77525.1 hypothetical protein FEF27_05055 [Nesterenkonia sphaerica]
MTDPVGPEPGAHQRPRWVKIAGLIVLAVAGLLLLLWVIGGPGEHGPERHSQAAPAGVSVQSADYGLVR